MSELLSYLKKLYDKYRADDLEWREYHPNNMLQNGTDGQFCYFFIPHKHDDGNNYDCIKYFIRFEKFVDGDGITRSDSRTVYVLYIDKTHVKEPFEMPAARYNVTLEEESNWPADVSGRGRGIFEDLETAKACANKEVLHDIYICSHFLSDEECMELRKYMYADRPEEDNYETEVKEIKEYWIKEIKKWIGLYNNFDSLEFKDITYPESQYAYIEGVFLDIWEGEKYNYQLDRWYVKFEYATHYETNEYGKDERKYDFEKGVRFYSVYSLEEDFEEKTSEFAFGDFMLTEGRYEGTFETLEAAKRFIKEDFLKKIIFIYEDTDLSRAEFAKALGKKNYRMVMS